VREAHKPKTQRVVKLAKIEKAIRSVLEAIGEDPEREGVKDTPGRVAKLYQRIFSGIGQDPTSNLKSYRVDNQDGMILVRDIAFLSMCEHHLLPFFGRIHLAYLPSENRVAGLSSLTKTVEILSQRPQLQERLANDIADALMKALAPQGLLVIVEAEHLCVAMNDNHKLGTSTISTAARGVMREEPTRAEAFSLIVKQSRTNTKKHASH